MRGLWTPAFAGVTPVLCIYQHFLRSYTKIGTTGDPVSDTKAESHSEKTVVHPVISQVKAVEEPAERLDVH